MGNTVYVFTCKGCKSNHSDHRWLLKMLNMFSNLYSGHSLLSTHDQFFFSHKAVMTNCLGANPYDVMTYWFMAATTYLVYIFYIKTELNDLFPLENRRIHNYNPTGWSGHVVPTNHKES